MTLMGSCCGLYFQQRKHNLRSIRGSYESSVKGTTVWSKFTEAPAPFIKATVHTLATGFHQLESPSGVHSSHVWLWCACILACVGVVGFKLFEI